MFTHLYTDSNPKRSEPHMFGSAMSYSKSGIVLIKNEMKIQFFVWINIIKMQVGETGNDYKIDCEKLKCNCNNRRTKRQVNITHYTLFTFELVNFKKIEKVVILSSGNIFQFRPTINLSIGSCAQSVQLFLDTNRK